MNLTAQGQRRGGGGGGRGGVGGREEVTVPDCSLLKVGRIFNKMKAAVYQKKNRVSCCSTHGCRLWLLFVVVAVAAAVLLRLLLLDLVLVLSCSCCSSSSSP